MADAFTAEIRMFGFQFAPRDWAYCSGQSIAINQFPALYSLISITYGGNGRTTMDLPNLQASAPMHPGRGPGLTPRILGETNGREDVRLNPGQLPEHTHTATSAKALGTSTAPTGMYPGIYSVREDDIYKKDPTLVDQQMNIEALSSAGQSAPHENMQPYLAVNFCICLDGIYPPRS